MYRRWKRSEHYGGIPGLPTELWGQVMSHTSPQDIARSRRWSRAHLREIGLMDDAERMGEIMRSSPARPGQEDTNGRPGTFANFFNRASGLEPDRIVQYIEREFPGEWAVRKNQYHDDLALYIKTWLLRVFNVSPIQFSELPGWTDVRYIEGYVRAFIRAARGNSDVLISLISQLVSHVSVDEMSGILSNPTRPIVGSQNHHRNYIFLVTGGKFFAEKATLLAIIDRLCSYYRNWTRRPGPDTLTLRGQDPQQEPQQEAQQVTNLFPYIERIPKQSTVEDVTREIDDLFPSVWSAYDGRFAGDIVSYVFNWLLGALSVMERRNWQRVGHAARYAATFIYAAGGGKSDVFALISRYCNMMERPVSDCLATLPTVSQLLSESGSGQMVVRSCAHEMERVGTNLYVLAFLYHLYGMI